ncbi:MucR family transcriptional regulator [Pectobacterium aroidearum]|uniref:MucR family transcriptional regulator n=1 Tax=Pectobacterium aroidearum TaxID=1201031 RepID=UPI0031580407
MKRINSRAELDEYLNHDKIECLECGKRFSFLASHLRKTHGMTADEYREKFNIPVSAPLAGLSYREAHRDKLNKMIQSGTLDYSHLPAAEKAARQAGRGKRRDFDLAEQAERAIPIHKNSPRTRAKDNMAEKLKKLFRELAIKHMRIKDVKAALALNQADFIEMLSVGIEDFSSKKPTRRALAEKTSISESRIYSYSAARNSVDYREISDETKISMIWHATSKYNRGNLTQTKAYQNAHNLMYMMRKRGETCNFSHVQLMEIYEEAQASGRSVFVSHGENYPIVEITDISLKNNTEASAKKDDFEKERVRLYAKMLRTGDATELDALYAKNGLTRKKYKKRN